MIVLVCGGRNYTDGVAVCSWLGCVHRNMGPITLLIEGGNREGADRLARMFADKACIPRKTFKADWDRFKRAAGPIRNQQMLDEGKPNLVVAFPGGRGTADMVKRARSAGVRVIRAVRRDG